MQERYQSEEYNELLKEYDFIEDRWIYPDERFEPEASSFGFIFPEEMLDQQKEKPTRETIAKAESILRLKFSEEFTRFLLTYGRISVGGMETIGLVNDKPEESPIIKYTNTFRGINRRFGDFVVFQLQTEYDWVMVNSRDTVFLCSLYSGKIESLHMGFFTYMNEECAGAKRRYDRTQKSRTVAGHEERRE